MKHAFHRPQLMRRARVAFAGIATGALVFAIAAPVTAAIVDIGDSGPISVNVPATASSTQWDNLDANAAEANDGNTGTRWGSAQGDDDAIPWIRYDLTQACLVTGAAVNWEGAYASEYTLVGWTGSAWEPFRSVTSGAPGPVNLADFEDLGPVQYVALVVDQKATVWGASIWELQFQGRDCAASSQDAPTLAPPSYASSGGGDEGGDTGGDDGGTDPGHTRGDLLSLGKPVRPRPRRTPGPPLPASTTVTPPRAGAARIATANLW